MIAFRNTAELDVLRPNLVRVHTLPEKVAPTPVAYAAALSFPQTATTQQVIDALRELRPEHSSVYYLFVTDPLDRLVGVVSLRDLVVAPPAVRLFEIMDRRMITLPEDASLAQQARVMAETGLLALPLVDREGHLVGALDASDMIAGVSHEATAEMCHLAGIGAAEASGRSVARAVWDRVLWLVLGLALALLAAGVVSSFVNTLSSVVLLAAFLPVLVVMGTRTGMQAVTVTVRSLTSGGLSLGGALRTLRRELAMGSVNGLCIGLAAGLAGWLWQGSLVLGIIVGVALLGDLIVAALIGATLPLLFKALRTDPALAAPVVVTGLTSVSGCFFLLSLATLALQMGYL